MVLFANKDDKVGTSFSLDRLSLLIMFRRKEMTHKQVIRKGFMIFLSQQVKLVGYMRK